jgi:cytochrome c556
MMKKLAFATLAGSLLLGTLNAQAADVDNAIEHRQGVFSAMKWYFGPMGAMIKGDMPYDQAEFTRRAEQLAKLAPMAEEGFVEGSAEGTEALPAIWEDMDTFSGGFDKLESTTAALVEASMSGDMAQIKPAFGDVAKTCKGCHDNFRED